MERLTIEFDRNYVPVGLCATTPEGEVDDLDGCKDHCEMIGEKCEECAIQKCFDKLGEYEDLEEQGLLRRMTTAYGWIPAEKPPKNGDYVLVWYEYFRYGECNCMYQTYGIGYYVDGHWSGDISGHKARCIAWQPLPEPYKGET